MSEPQATGARRPDYGLYVGEGIVVIGAVIFLIGFAIEKSSNTPGKALEATGIVVFAVGLFVAAAFAHLLTRHFARTTSDPLVTMPLLPITESPTHLGYSDGRLHPAVSDPVVPLSREVAANPEDDMAAARLIERERHDAQDAE